MRLLNCKLVAELLQVHSTIANSAPLCPFSGKLILYPASCFPLLHDVVTKSIRDH